MSPAGVSMIACIVVLFALALAEAAWRTRHDADLRRRWRSRRSRPRQSRHA
jgi:hypothetical protein